MEDRMHFIDNFFLGLLSKEEVRTFENKIENDPAFANDVAFYLSSKQAARELLEEEAKNRYKELFSSKNGYHEVKKTGKVRKMWYAIGACSAAAISTAVILNVFLWSTPTLQEVAGKYVNQNYHELGVNMGRGDEMQKGVDLYNGGQYAQAMNQFEGVVKRDSSFTAVEYAGLSALNIHDYNNALKYFYLMENYRSQFSNPAVLLQAITYLERNKPGDKEQAKLLLEKIKNNQLEGKETADDWIKRFNK